MTKSKVTYDSEFNGSKILTDQDKKQGCYVNILESIKDNFDHMADKHSKVLFMRYDIRFPQDNKIPEQDKTFRDFHANWIKNLKRNNLDPHYLWTREQSKEKHSHYHGILLLDGNKTQSIHGHIEKAEELWHKALDIDPANNKGLVNDCTKGRDGTTHKNGIMLRKDDPEYTEKKNQCFEWSSYLAKENTKGNAPKGCRTFAYSRLK